MYKEHKLFPNSLALFRLNESNLITNITANSDIIVDNATVLRIDDAYFELCDSFVVYKFNIFYGESTYTSYFYSYVEVVIF